MRGANTSEGNVEKMRDERSKSAGSTAAISEAEYWNQRSDRTPNSCQAKRRCVIPRGDNINYRQASTRRSRISTTLRTTTSGLRWISIVTIGVRP